MKKAQGMSLNVIIVAVIVLIILVVLVLIFSGKIKFFGAQTSDTSSKYTSNKCEIPGTNNECWSSPEDCTAKGGSFDERTEYSDCPGSCCMR